MRKLVVSVLTVLVACVQPQPQPGYYPQQPQPQGYGQPQPYGGNGYGGSGYGGGYYSGGYDPNAGQPPPPPPQGARHFTFNGRPASAGDLQVVAQIEAMYGRPAPSGDYWYDARSGAMGAWGGPALGFLPAGLPLGGPLPANASGGGDGRLTGVFINGRELHPIDVRVLMSLYGQVIPGRWWVDAQGNAGQEGGPPLLNLVQLARQRGKGAESYYRSDGRGNNAFVGGGCVSVSSTVGSGDSKSTYDYYGSGC